MRCAQASANSLRGIVRKISTRTGAAPSQMISSGPAARSSAMAVAGAPNCRSAVTTRARLSGSSPIYRSRSFVKRGRPWYATA